MSATATYTLDLSGLQRELVQMGIEPAQLDFTRGLQAVSVYYGAQAKQCFARSATPDGDPWPPFKRTPSRRRGGKSAKLLVDKGLLMASMSARQAQGAVRDITRTTLEQGSNLDYAGAQNFGTGTIPARQFAGITEAMAARTEELIADDVLRQLGFA
jgi:phage gpG-like protein